MYSLLVLYSIVDWCISHEAFCRVLHRKASKYSHFGYPLLVQVPSSCDYKTLYDIIRRQLDRFINSEKAREYSPTSEQSGQYSIVAIYSLRSCLLDHGTC